MTATTTQTVLVCAFFLSLFVASWPSVSGAKLLVFGVSSSRSHMISNGRIADALADAGHNVTLVNLECFVSSIGFPLSKKARVMVLGKVPDEAKQSHADAVKQMFHPSVFQTYSSLAMFTPGVTGACERALDLNQAELEELKKEKFDAIFVEHLFPCGNALAHVLGIPVHFIVHSCPLQDHMAELFGFPLPLGYVPSSGQQSLTDDMDFWGRVWNQMEHWLVTRGYAPVFDATTQLFRRRFGADFPDVKELIRDRTPVMFVAASELLDFPRPVTHDIVHVGGVGMPREPPTHLPEPFRTQVTLGAKGVVFFSLGSNVITTSLPMPFKRNLLDAFGALPEWHFIVKLEAQDEEARTHAAQYPNVFATPWAPQPALLAHARVRLFVTHGGYNSVLEVAGSGKPVLLIPMMYDQTRNAMAVQRNGWGRVLDRRSLLTDAREFRELLSLMLNDQNFTIAAKRTQKLLQTKPFSGTEVFTKTVDFVLQNDGRLPELRSRATQLSFVQQFNLDVLAFLASAVLTVFLTFAWAVWRVWCRLRTSTIIGDPAKKRQ